jgi:hypothetical protein
VPLVANWSLFIVERPAAIFSIFSHSSGVNTHRQGSTLFVTTRRSAPHSFRRSLTWTGC